MIPAHDLLAQPLSSWVGGRPGRQVLITLATAVTSNSWLADPTGRYLPSEVADRFRDTTGRAYAAAITLRQLLDHTSGLPNFFSQPRS
jgi:hypothetical protein